MTKQVQRRRGTATQHTSFTGAEGELSVNTTNKSVHVHDNVTAGGFEAARADMDNVTSSSILTAAGITATTTELNYVDGVTSSIQTQLDGKAGTASPTFTGTLTTANLTATGTTTLAGASTSADITFGDNDKAIFGAGSDLQIYHDGSNNSSYIKETGAGSFNIEATNLFLKREGGTENFIDCVTNGAVTAYYDGSPKLATTSTGVEITGTLTSDDVSIADTSPTLLFNRTDRATDNKIIRFAHDGEDFQLQLANDAVSSVTPAIAINRTGMSLDSIAFYEDTGTTPKFFWDASAESLGIGMSSPEGSLHLNGSFAGRGLVIDLATEGVTDNVGTFNAKHSAGILAFQTNSTERMRIDSSGNVGIGTSSPSKTLHVYGSNATAFIDSQTGTSYPSLQIGGSGTAYFSIDTDLGNPTANGTLIRTIGGAYPLRFGVDSTERMRITSSGNVGIGTSSPSAKLDLKGTAAGNEMLEITHSGASQPWKFISGENGVTNEAFIIDRGASGEWLRFHAGLGTVFSYDNTERMRIDSNGNVIVKAGKELRVNRPDDGTYGAISHGTSGTGIVYNDQNGDGHHWQFAGSEKMRIDSSGNLLVGTTSNAGVNGLSISPQGTHTALQFNASSTSNFAAYFKYFGTNVGTISYTNTSTTYNTSSDYRLKTDAQPMTGASARVQALNPVNFEWIASGERVDGFLAHEAQAIVPEAVTGTKDAVDADGNPEYQGIDQSKLVPLLTAALQEALTKIDALETRITALEG